MLKDMSRSPYQTKKYYNWYPEKYKPTKGLDEWLYFNPYILFEEQLKLKIFSKIIGEIKRVRIIRTRFVIKRSRK